MKCNKKTINCVCGKKREKKCQRGCVVINEGGASVVIDQIDIKGEGMKKMRNGYKRRGKNTLVVTRMRIRYPKEG